MHAVVCVLGLHTGPRAEYKNIYIYVYKVIDNFVSFVLSGAACMKQRRSLAVCIEATTLSWAMINSASFGTGICQKTTICRSFEW